jgi:hypothetical protein
MMGHPDPMPSTALDGQDRRGKLDALATRAGGLPIYCPGLDLQEPIVR